MPPNKVDDVTMYAVVSHLLQIEETTLATIDDFSPDVLALQSRRVGELRYLLGRLALASAPGHVVI